MIYDEKDSIPFHNERLHVASFTFLYMKLNDTINNIFLCDKDVTIQAWYSLFTITSYILCLVQYTYPQY